MWNKAGTRGETRQEQGHMTPGNIMNKKSFFALRSLRSTRGFLVGSHAVGFGLSLGLAYSHRLALVAFTHPRSTYPIVR